MRIRLLMNGNCIGLCEGHFDTLRRSAVLYSIPFKIEMDQSHLVAIFISHSFFSPSRFEYFRQHNSIVYLLACFDCLRIPTSTNVAKLIHDEMKQQLIVVEPS